MNDNLEKKSIYLPKELVDRILEKAKKNKRSFSNQCVFIIEAALHEVPNERR